jgi:transcriptional regulator with XRE-family HTH domain
MNFGEKLKESRAHKGLSQQELADRVGSKKQNIAAYEQGRAEPDNALLLKIAGVLDVDPGWLLGLQNSKNPRTSNEKERNVSIWESRVGHFTEQEKKDLDKFIAELIAEGDEFNRKNAIEVARVVLGKKGKKKKE